MSTRVWSTLSRVRERNPLASEGISVCTTVIAGETYLAAFGGYNGKYQNEIFVMKPKPRESAPSKILQSPAAAASVTTAYALTKPEKPELAESIDSIKFFENNVSQKDAGAELTAIKEEKNALEVTLAEIREDNSKQRETIDEANNTLSELSKELLSVQGQLVAERSRCFKLEAQIVELQKVLESISSVENEVYALRSRRRHWNGMWSLLLLQGKALMDSSAGYLVVPAASNI